MGEQKEAEIFHLTSRKILLFYKNGNTFFKKIEVFLRIFLTGNFIYLYNNKLSFIFFRQTLPLKQSSFS